MTVKQIQTILPDIRDVPKGYDEYKLKDFYDYMNKCYENELTLGGINALNGLYNEHYDEIREYFINNKIPFSILYLLVKNNVKKDTIYRLIKKNYTEKQFNDIIDSKLGGIMLDFVIDNNESVKLVGEINKYRFNNGILRSLIDKKVDLNEVVKLLKQGEKTPTEIYETLTSKEYEGIIQDSINKELDKVPLISMRHEKREQIIPKGRKIKDEYAKDLIDEVFSDEKKILSDKEIIEAYDQLYMKVDKKYQLMRESLDTIKNDILKERKDDNELSDEQKKKIAFINNKIELLNFITANKSSLDKEKKEIFYRIRYIYDYMVFNRIDKFEFEIEDEEKTKFDPTILFEKFILDQLGSNKEYKKEITDTVKFIQNEFKGTPLENKIKDGMTMLEEDSSDALITKSNKVVPSELRKNDEIWRGDKLFNVDGKNMREKLRFGEGFGNDFGIFII